MAIALAVLAFSCKKDEDPNIQSITYPNNRHRLWRVCLRRQNRRHQDAGGAEERPRRCPRF